MKKLTIQEGNSPKRPILKTKKVSLTGKKGFTLVELIIVITILAILVTIAFVSLNGYMKDTRDANRLTTFKNIETGIELFAVKKGNYPTPDDAQVFTGGLEGKSQISQGILGENISRTIGMNKMPLDPKENTPYYYSVFGNGEYYQLGGNAENIQAGIFPIAYAGNDGALIYGNYRFDPSLPSLFLVKNSIETGGLFDPKNCFIIDGGRNNFKSNVDDCEKKEEMSLREFDNGLQGYWTFDENGFVDENHQYGGGNFFKDYSGNGHTAFNSGTIQGAGFVRPTQVEGYMGNGLYFTSGSLILGYDSEFNIDQEFTLSAIFLASELQKNPYPQMFSSSLYIIHLNVCDKYPEESDCATLLPQGLGYNGNGLQIYNRGSASGAVVNPDGTLTDAIQRKPLHKNIYEDYYLISVVFSKNHVKRYLNGIKIADIKQDNFIFGKHPNLSTQTNRLGGTLAGRTRDFHGIIDDVKIYNRALSDEEILQQAKIAGF